MPIPAARGTLTGVHLQAALGADHQRTGTVVADTGAGGQGLGVLAAAGEAQLGDERPRPPTAPGRRGSRGALPEGGRGRLLLCLQGLRMRAAAFSGTLSPAPALVSGGLP